MKKYLVLALLLLPVFANSAEMEETIISATLSPFAKQNRTSAITVLTAQDLELRGQLFLLDALRFVPGISITQEGGPGAFAVVRIRGGESDHTKVFIDGVEVNEIGFAGFNFANLQTSQIERVEIVRGAQSLVHGANATAGVIYITTKTSAADFNFSAGSFRTINVAGNIGDKIKSPIGDINFGLGLDVYTTRGHDISTAGENENDGYFNATLRGKIGLDKKIANHKIKLSSSLRYVSSQFDGDHFSFFNPTNPDEAADQKDEQIEVGIYGAYDVDLPLSLTLHNSLRGFFLLAERDVINPGASTESGQDRYHIVYKSSLDFRRIATLTAILGWEEEKYEREDDRVLVVDKSEVEQFVGVEAQASLYGVDLTAGLRGEFYNNSENDILWRVTAGWLPPFQNIIRLRGSYGTSLNKPTLLDLYGFFPDSFTPNPDLRPEKAQSFDGGVEVDLNGLLSGLTLSATGFAIYIEDEITGFSTPINAEGTSKRRGAEFETEWLIGDLYAFKNLYLATSYTYTNAKQANGQRSENRPRHVATISMGVDFTQFGLGWDLSWQSDQLAFNGRVGSYPLLNIYAHYNANKKLTFYVRGENLTSERTANTVGYERRGAGIYFGVKGRL